MGQAKVQLRCIRVFLRSATVAFLWLIMLVPTAALLLLMGQIRERPARREREGECLWYIVDGISNPCISVTSFAMAYAYNKNYMTLEVERPSFLIKSFIILPINNYAK